MTRSLTNVPRWLLTIEMAVCLVPLTCLFVAVLSTTARGIMPLEYGVLTSSATVLGPIGLAVALRLVFWPSGAVGRATTVILVSLAAWTALAYAGQVVHSGAPLSGWWREFVLIAVLPGWAVMHLLQINAGRRSPTAVA